MPLLFQNGDYLDRTVLEEDREALRDALDKMKMQKHTGIFFRIRDEDGCPRWLVMLGMPAPETPAVPMEASVAVRTIVAMSPIVRLIP